MKKAEVGDKVKVHYTGKLKNGEVFDTSIGRNPLEFTIGQNQVLQKFETTVEGMEIGQNSEVFIPAEEAYGNRYDHLVAKVPKTNLPENLKPEIGMKLQTQTKEGETIVVKITEVGDTEITIDANHELADEDLQFEIELVEIN